MRYAGKGPSDERQLEAAGDEAEVEQPEAPMAEGGADGIDQALAVLDCIRAVGRSLPETGRQWRYREHEDRKHQERRRPVHVPKKLLGNGHHNELAQATDCAGNTQRPTSVLRLNDPTERAEDRPECRAGKSDPDQDAVARVKSVGVADWAMRRRPKP